MALIAPPRSRLKPAPWAFDPGLVAPRWGWFWHEALGTAVVMLGAGDKLNHGNRGDAMVGHSGVGVRASDLGAVAYLQQSKNSFIDLGTVTVPSVENIAVFGVLRRDTSQDVGGVPQDIPLIQQQSGNGNRVDLNVMDGTTGAGAPRFRWDIAGAQRSVLLSESWATDEDWIALWGWYDGATINISAEKLDGSESESNSAAQTGSVDSQTGTMYVGADPGELGSETWPGEIACCYVWYGFAPNKAQRDMLTADPFGPFRPARRRVVFVSAGGTTFERTFAGSATASGLIVRQAQKTVAGTATPAGALARQTQKTLTGSVTPSGTLDVLKTVLQSFAGTLTAAGSLALQTAKTLTGSATPFGALTKQTAKSFSGSLTPSGTLEAIKTVLLSMAGSITTSGALTLQTTKDLAGSLTAAGSLTRRTDKTMTGSVTPSGTLQALRTVLLSIAGSITPSGSLTRRISKTLTGSITPSGAITRRISKLVVGALTMVGTLATALSSPGATPAPRNALGPDGSVRHLGPDNVSRHLGPD